MNKFESELMSIAYKNYLQTGSTYGSFQMRNGNDFMSYHTAAQHLVEKNYIIALSDNIFSDSVSVFDFLLEFEITSLGISVLEEALKK